MRDTGISIKVDIDELMDKLDAMREDDFVTVEIAFNSNGYDSEIELTAVGIDEDEKISYGKIEGQNDDFI